MRAPVFAALVLAAGAAWYLLRRRPAVVSALAPLPLSQPGQAPAVALRPLPALSPYIARPGAPAMPASPAAATPAAVLANLRQLLGQEEGVKQWAYDDLTGKPWTISKKGKATIGIGHLILPTESYLLAYTPANPAPPGLVEKLFAQDTATARAAVDKLKVPLSAPRQAALASLAFNIGAGAFARSLVAARVKAGDLAGAANAFMNWTTGNGVKGLLTARRQRERAIFLKG